MFHNFVRLSRFPHVLKSSYTLFNGNKYVAHLNENRFYCKDSKDGPKKVKEKVNICVTSRKNPYDVCNPGKKRPCVPSPPPYNVGPRKCPGPSKMDMMPKPACAWDKRYQDNNKKYMRHLIIGILFAAVTLIVLWKKVEFTKPVDEEKKKAYKRPKPKCRIPGNANEIPTAVPYLLVGGGTASFSAFRAIKSADPTAKVLVVSNECYFPYMRPPLSKELWFSESEDEKNLNKLIFKQWNGTERSLFYEPNDFYVPSSRLLKSPNGGVSVIQGYTVEKIDVVEKIAYLDNGVEIEYEKCLIATGGKPKNLDLFAKSKPEIQDKVTLYRDIFDFQELYELCKDIKSVAIIGGGFLGSELACALGKISQRREDLKVYQIYKEKGNMGKVLPEYLSEWTTSQVRRERVNIIKETEVEDAVLNDKNKLVLHLNNGDKLIVDHVVVAIGIKPNTELAKTSDLEIDPECGGFLVNAEMEARSHLYVAGDASCFYDIKLGRRRVEHHDHAVVSGRLAGENMTGAAKPYLHQSMFWSDLGPSVGYEAIGLVDSKLPTVAVFAKATASDNPQAVVTATNNNLRSTTEEEAGKLGAMQVDSVQETSLNETKGISKNDFGKGVIFYLRNDIVVGIVLWNVFNRMSIARQVLKDERKYDDLNEVAKLFNIHEK